MMRRIVNCWRESPFARSGYVAMGRIPLIASCALLAITSFAGGAVADNWIDVLSGQRVTSLPVVTGPDGKTDWVRPDISDRNRAFDPKTGRNFAFDPDRCIWVDTKTGKRVADFPVVTGPDGKTDWVRPDISDRNRAFDPKTGRNFAREPCPPRTETTPQVTPEVGMIIEPKIGGGLGGSSSSPTYVSTGGQPPFSGDASPTTGQVCGGAGFYPGFGLGPARVGLDVNVCSGSNTFGSGDTLFRIMRHGPGDVDLHASTNVIIDVLFKGEVPIAPIGPSNNLFLSAGVGPTFRDQNLTLTSNQSFFGGGVPSMSDSTWQTGFGFSAGLSTFVCPACVAGNPLKVGVEGHARFFPSQSISLTSPAFGFTEMATTGRTTDYSVLFTIGVPLAFSISP